MNATTAISGNYDFRLVALSIVLALFASYAALDLTASIRSAKGWARTIWLSCGASAIGLGIGAMHYVGMLALRMPMPVAYHLPTVGLSLLAAIAASGVALFVSSRASISVWPAIAGSIGMGVGIGAMHYVGMAAMRCAALISYDRRVVALSIVLAITISMVALHLAFHLRLENRGSQRKTFSAVIMGSAIALMHYIAMWAATFYPSALAPDLRNAVHISSIGLTAVIVCTFLVLAGAIACSFFDRFMEAQKGSLNAAREQELYFHTMAEALPEMIWTATPQGEDDYFNQNCFDYTGKSLAQMQGSQWKDIVHPDDVENCSIQWQAAMRTGQPYSTEYRLRAKDGSYRWFVGRANPIRDAKGEIVKWFGTCTDIESQKQNQQILEEQILERTIQLGDANTRLQEEMAGKDLARRELDEQNERMMKDLKKRSEHATMLAKLGELLQSCINREEVFAAALGFAPKIFPDARGALALLNSPRNLAEVIGSWAGCQLPEMEFEPNSCWALRTGHPHLVLEGDSTARCAHASGVNHTFLCIPIMAQRETLGILHLQATDEMPHLDTTEFWAKTTFAGQVGLSIANIRLREALQTQSVRDALTGLYNRRYLEEVLDREVRRASRAAQSLGILMIDLDHFKSFNDTYGHDAGDAVLREIAVSLTKGIRAEDFVCRFGGEEFVVILPTADLASSKMRAERLRTKTKELTVLHQGKSMGMITISVGVAVFPIHGTSPKDLMSAADVALYEAKRGGRDQVVVAIAKETEELAATLGAFGDSWG
jgi:diguanylate cyclase (GGDEF)-like protein/PAS domain S-box-containing protein